MNKLEIARSVNTLAGTQGTIDSVTVTTGYQATLVHFIDKAYSDVQLFRSNWKFMRLMVQAPLSTTVSTFLNTDIAEVRYCVYNHRRLREIPYNEWILRDSTDTGKPEEFSVDETTGIIYFNASDASYIVDIYYDRVPNTMSANTDVPILPVRFHNAIVFKALIYMGNYLGNPELISGYGTEYSIIMGQMMRSQLARESLRLKPFFVNGNLYNNWYV